MSATVTSDFIQSQLLPVLYTLAGRPLAFCQHGTQEGFEVETCNKASLTPAVFTLRGLMSSQCCRTEDGDTFASIYTRDRKTPPLVLERVASGLEKHLWTGTLIQLYASAHLAFLHSATIEDAATLMPVSPTHKVIFETFVSQLLSL